MGLKMIKSISGWRGSQGSPKSCLPLSHLWSFFMGICCWIFYNLGI